MLIPSRIVSLSELRRNTGERGTRKFVAYEGVVYDVTDCPRWRGDLHEQLHFPGQDLTSELPDAPHQEEIFKRDANLFPTTTAAKARLTRTNDHSNHTSCSPLRMSWSAAQSSAASIRKPIRISQRLMSTSESIVTNESEKSSRDSFVAICGRVFRADPEFFPQADYRGRTIYLCTDSCLGAYLSDPDRFVNAHKKSYEKKGAAVTSEVCPPT